MTTESPETYRLFFALWPDAAVRRAIQTYADAWKWPVSRARVAADDLHLTLHFLGNVAIDRLPALQDLPVSFDPFVLHLDDAAHWKHGIAVLCPREIPPELIRLHGLLAESISAAGIKLDARPYRPHVTLARRAVEAVPPPACAGIAWRVDRVVLVQSRSEQHPRYTVLYDYPASDAASESALPRP